MSTLVLRHLKLLGKYGAPQNVIVGAFGMMETCAGTIYHLECPDYDIKNGHTVASLGKCIEGIEMRVTVPNGDSNSDSDGIEIPDIASPNVPGNLDVRGAVVFDSYYRNTEAMAEAFTSDGWFRTGDQAICF